MKKAICKCFLAIALLSLGSCSLLTDRSVTGKGQLRLSIGSAAIARTLVADPSLLSIDSYTVRLMSRDGHPEQVQSGSLTSFLFSELELGTWDVEVEALSGGKVVARGSSEGNEVSAGEEVAITVSLGMAQSSEGLGGYSLSIALPEDTGIDHLKAQLMTRDGKPFGSPIEPGFTDLDGVRTTVVRVLDVPSGSYRLLLDFRRGGANGTPAGLFSESVTVWDNVISDRWISPFGELVGTRSFAAEEFFSTDASLSTLTLNHDGFIIDFAFSSLLTDYTLTVDPSPRTSFYLSWGLSCAGQQVAWSAGSGGVWTELSGATSAALDLPLDCDSLLIRVTAPDGATTRVYALKLAWEPDTSVPDAPANFTATGGDGVVRFSWDAPAIGSVSTMADNTSYLYPSSGGLPASYWMPLNPATNASISATAVITSYGVSGPSAGASGAMRQAILPALVMDGGLHPSSQQDEFTSAFSADGAVFAAGSIHTGSYTFGGMPLALTEATAVLIKYEPDGSALWLARSEGSGGAGIYAVAAMFDGGVAVAGYAGDHVTFGGLDTGEGFGAIVARFYANGTIAWVRKVRVASNGTSFNSVTVAPDGKIAVCGSMSDADSRDFGNGIQAAGASASSNAVIALFDPDGNALWAESTEGASPYSSLGSVCFTSDGDIVATGSAGAGAFQMASATLTSSGGNIVLRFSAAGAPVWMKTGLDGTWPVVLAPNGNGGVVLAGGSQVGLIDAAGERTWTRTSSYLGGIRGIACDSAGNTYLAGVVGGAAEYGYLFDLDEALARAVTLSGCLLVKISSVGQGLWAVSNSADKSLRSYASVSVASDGTIYCGGSKGDNFGYSPAVVKYIQ